MGWLRDQITAENIAKVREFMKMRKLWMLRPLSWQLPWYCAQEVSSVITGASKTEQRMTI
jgi:aryl-alcohol dehydrogenase-like predicted oxidoreductase